MCEMAELDYPAIRSGVHEWTVEIEETCYRLSVGVTLTGMIPNAFAFGTPQGWMYSNEGFNSHVQFQFGKGSKVTLTLDMQAGGTLSARVDNGAQINLHSDLRSHLNGPTGGFVPAVSLCLSGRVRIIEIEKLQG